MFSNVGAWEGRILRPKIGPKGTSESEGYHLSEARVNWGGRGILWESAVQQFLLVAATGSGKAAEVDVSDERRENHVF